MAKRTTKKTTKATPARDTAPPATSATGSGGGIEYIHEGLRSYAVPIDTLTLDPENARLHDGRNLDTIESMLAAFGQRRLVVVQKKGMVVRVGNGRVKVARERLGWTHIAALVVDEGDDIARAFGIADNRTAELAGWDFQTLAGIMRELQQAGHDLAGIGFEPYEIEPLMQADFAPSLPKAGGSGVGAGGDRDATFVVAMEHDDMTAVDAIVPILTEQIGTAELDRETAMVEACERYLSGRAHG